MTTNIDQKKRKMDQDESYVEENDKDSTNDFIINESPIKKKKKPKIHKGGNFFYNFRLTEKKDSKKKTQNDKQKEKVNKKASEKKITGDLSIEQKNFQA